MSTPTTALATIPAAPTAPVLFMAAFSAFCAAPTDASLSDLTTAAKVFIPAAPAIAPVAASANTATWRAVTDPTAFNTDFTEIRVETSKPLRSDALEMIGQAVGYALKETILGDELVLIGVEQLPELSNGHIVDGGGKSVLTYEFDSTSSRRSAPDYSIAFDVADTRIFHGSKVRLTNKAGAGTKGTKLVEGIGPGRCTVAFFVR